MIVISDASPLITLLDAGYIDLLKQMYGTVIIPPEVEKEVFDSGRRRAKPSWIKVQNVTAPTSLRAFAEMRFTLHKGESEGIALAMELSATILIDEEVGTNECQKRHVACLSTADVVRALRSQQHISQKEFERIKSDLRLHGVYV